MITLAVEKRAGEGPSAAALRREGKVPGVVYGAHHEASPISVDARVFGKVLAEAGEATVVALKGLGDEVPVLIHEVNLDPLTSQPRHIDFYAITKGEKVEVNIPLEFINEAPAAKAGANIVKVLHEIEVEADPMQLPHDIQVDLSVLENIDDQIHVKDLKVPAGVTVLTSEDDVVALAQEVVEEPEEEVAPADISSVEVEKKGKEEGDGEAAAEAPAE